MLQAVIVLLATASTLISSQTCSDSNNNCYNWNQNGFCSSSFYTQATKRAYCARTCGLCGNTGNVPIGGGAQPGGGTVPIGGGAQPCRDNHAMCATFASNGFCTSSFYTQLQKQEFCAKTCNLCNTGNSQCVDNNVNCAAFSSNGFCTNTAYTLLQRYETCARTCNLCNAFG